MMLNKDMNRMKKHIILDRVLGLNGLTPTLILTRLVSSFKEFLLSIFRMYL